MKMLYLDCGMGAAGDMLAGALIELFEDKEALLGEINALGIPGVHFTRQVSKKCGIYGTHLSVEVDGVEEGEQGEGDIHHHHRSMKQIEGIIDALPVSAKVKGDIHGVYSLLAAAESGVHGVPVTEIHFHEVGTMDAIADIVAVCFLLDCLGAERIVSSPVCVGSGQVLCRHGLLPVPAPATAELLCHVPIYAGDIKGELCTPTGAALLKFFVSSFEKLPKMIPARIGYGMGKKDFAAANCLRAIFGESGNEAEEVGNADEVLTLLCNIDDMTGEEIGFATERLLEEGALDVFCVPIVMKKSRPATSMQVLCAVADRDKMVKALFRYTSTLGIRENRCSRYLLKRELATVNTPYGKVRRKDAFGYGVHRFKYEYDDLAKIAKAEELSLQEVVAVLDKVDVQR